MKESVKGSYRPIFEDQKIVLGVRTGERCNEGRFIEG